MNPACQVHTTGFDLPDRRMISAVPQPSAVARITLARHTCFCGALRSATIASSRRRSARVTLTTIPALIESLDCFDRFGNRPNESDHYRSSVLIAAGGPQARGKDPHGHWKTMTFLAALRCDRIG